MCPCDPAGSGKSRHGKDKACHISQCVAAATSKDPEALRQVARGPCACGYSWPACSRPMHVMAQDALAECLEKADQHVSAFSTALSTVRLDPASAVVSLPAGPNYPKRVADWFHQGYCRSAKILRRLLNTPLSENPTAERAAAAILGGSDGPPSAARLRALLALIVASGVHLTKSHRQGPKTTYDVSGPVSNTESARLTSHLLPGRLAAHGCQPQDRRGSERSRRGVPARSYEHGVCAAATRRSLVSMFQTTTTSPLHAHWLAERLFDMFAAGSSASASGGTEPCFTMPGYGPT